MSEATSENPPRPPKVQGVPFFHNTFQFLQDTSGLLNDAYTRYGPVYRLRALWLKYSVIAGFEAKDFLQQGLAEKYLSGFAPWGETNSLDTVDRSLVFAGQRRPFRAY